jgi:hypothetical protein
VILHKLWSGPALAVVGAWSTLIITSSVEAGHTPLEIVQRKVAEEPITKPVTPEVGEAGVVIVAVPATTVHTPEPIAGTLPARVAAVTLQSVWSGPAVEAVGRSEIVIITSSVDGAQLPLLIVQRRVAEVPTTKPVTPEVGEAGVVMVATPATNVHKPEPEGGVLPARVATVELQSVWSVPALATVEGAPILIATSSVELAQEPLDIVQRRVTEEPIAKPVTVEVGELGEVIVAKPATTDHVPLPTAAVLPASVVVVTLQRFWSAPADATVGAASICITTSSEEEAQPAEVMVQRSVAEVPGTSPVKPEVGEAGVVMVATPVTTVHKPEPITAVLPASVAVVELQIVWSTPAAAIVGAVATVIVTSSEELAQEPLDIVQRRVTEVPTTSPLTPEVGEAGVVIVATPATTVQRPVPTTGALPASVVIVELQIPWSGPAAAAVGKASTLIITSSKEDTQAPEEIVQRKVTEVPGTSAVTPDTAEAGVVIVAAPVTTVHTPVPTTGVLAASVAVVALQSVWSGPAVDAVGGGSTVITISSKEAGQEAFVIDQRSVAEVPTTNPVTPEVGEAGVVIVAIPETTLHTPTPTPAELADKVVAVILHKLWSGPALAVVGAWSTLIITSSVEAGQTPLEIVHRKVAEEPITNPVTPEVGEAGVVIVAVPATTLQAPEPIAGTLPASVAIVTLQSVWSGPAVEAVGRSEIVIITSSVDGVHPGAVMVQRSVVEAPIVNPVILEVGEAGVVIVAAPATTVHRPEPVVGTFPASVAIVELHIFWSGPAAAVVIELLILITTSSVDGAHEPLDMVQRSVTDVPATNAVKVDVGEAGVVIVAAPAIILHIPVPETAVLAARVVDDPLQIFWSVPAFATVGVVATFITTSSDEVGQIPFVIVQRSVAEPPITKPVTPEVAEAGVVIVAIPETTVHKPVPIAGALPASVAVVILQRFWSGPALAVVGAWSILSITSSLLLPQPPLDIVHRNVTLVPNDKPVTVEVGEAGVVIVAIPATTVHVPLPTPGVLPASVVVVTLHNVWSAPAAARLAGAAILMTTSSIEAAQGALLIVHLNVTEAPTVNPVTVEIGEPGAVIVAVPATIVQAPFPMDGVLAPSVVLVTLHRSWLGPASAVVGGSETFITTSSLLLPQPPFDIVHLSVALVPGTKPVTPDVGEAGVVIVAEPAITVQVPLPVVAVLPASVAIAVLHKFWSSPAAAVVAGEAIFIITSSVDVAQVLLEVVQRIVTDEPIVKPVIVEVGDEGVVMVAVPATTVHTPVPIEGVLPDRVVVVTLHKFWSSPASAVVGGSATFIITSSVLIPQPPLVMVHLSVAEVPGTKPVSPDVGEAGVVIVAMPLTTVHVPVPEAGIFPARVAIAVLHKFWSGPAFAAEAGTAILITTSSVEAAQGALLIVHLNVTEVPSVIPVTVEVGDAGVVMVAGPLTTVHKPVPTVGVFAANVAEARLQRFWSTPALAVVGSSFIVITTSSDEVHVPLDVVHLNVADVPGTSPVSPDVAEAGVVIVAAPLTTVHKPVPTPGVLPANVAVVELHIVWSAPAFAAVGVAAILITISSVDAAQLPLDIVQRKVALAPIVNPVTPEVGEAGVVIVAAPATTVHKPLPTTAGVFAESEAVVTLHRLRSMPASAVVGNEFTVITTSSLDVHVPLLVVQRSVTDEPTTNPVSVEVAEAGVVIVAIPATTVHVPLPTPGVFPASVAFVILQICWSGPALAAVGGAAILITTSSVEAAQGLFNIVQRKVADVPTTKPVIPDVGEAGVVIVATPATTLHEPEPTVAVFPARVVIVTLHKFWSGPAAAEVGVGVKLITIWSITAVHVPLAVEVSVSVTVPAVLSAALGV